MAIKKSQYSILVDVDLNTDTINQQLKDIQKKIEPIVFPGIKDTSKDVKDLGEATSKAAKDVDELNSSTADALLTYQAAHEIFQKSVDAIMSIVDAVYTLNDAEIEFQKVSDLSGQALDDYVDKLAGMGGAVGRTASEMLNATTEFRKNGFNDEDAAQLGQIATMFQNVSDEAISAGDAASFIIAQLTAFNLTAEDATHVIDAVNKVSNNFSVSSGDLSKALGVVSSSSSAMGNSMESTLGMLTAITEITRNSSKAARGNSI